jgi:hypothetical protein
MKRTIPWLAVILFLGCLVLGYLVIQEKTEITQVTVGKDAADNDDKDARARNAELQHQLADTKSALALAEKQVARAAADSAAAVSRPQGGSAKGGPNVVHLSDIMKDHPEYVALYAKQTRRNIDRMYGDSLDTLNLAPAQLSQLKNLLAERQMNNIDAQAAADAAGLERGSPAWQEAMKQAAQDTAQQMAAILGSNADSTLAQLQTRAGFQTQVESVYKSDFVDAGVPLSPEQSGTLVQALSDANYSGKDLSTRPAGYNDPDPATGLTPHESRILDSASQVLSPAQLQIVKTDLVENRQMSAIMNEYNKGGVPMMVLP